MVQEEESAEPAVEEKIPMNLAGRCMTYCEFTQNCLREICTRNPTVSVETCFSQCLESGDLDQQELTETMSQGCQRTQAVYCQTGLLDKKCNCAKSPQSQCDGATQCSLPLTNQKWACGTAGGKTPKTSVSCNFFHPCFKGDICVGFYSHASSGVCLKSCSIPSSTPLTPQKSPIDTQGIAQTPEK